MLPDDDIASGEQGLLAADIDVEIRVLFIHIPELHTGDAAGRVRKDAVGATILVSRVKEEDEYALGGIGLC
jgi:hypothetical protein